MNKIPLTIMIFPLIFSYYVSYAHGVHYNKIEGGIGIEAFYDDKSPISYSEVKVYSPENKEIEFQQGFTDKNGCFIFYPDKKGKWKIIVNDGMGHGLIEEISVNEELGIENKSNGHFSRWQKILIGISLIFGITGVLFYYSAKRQLRS